MHCVHVSRSRTLLQHTQSGLDKLAGAARTVDDLSRQAEAQRSLLATKQEEADNALTHIQVGTNTDGLTILAHHLVRD